MKLKMRIIIISMFLLCFSLVNAAETSTTTKKVSGESVVNASTVVNATKIEFKPSIINLENGKSAKLNLVLTPNNTNETITYTSSNPKGVSCDNNGNVKANKETDPVTITAKTSSGLEATCEVVVPKKGKIRTVLTSGFGLPELFENNIIESSDSSVVAVENGRFVHKNYGECVITGHLKEHPEILSFRYDYYVLESLESNDDSNVIKATKMAFEPSIINLEIGETAKLNLVLTPSNANETITYTSSNPKGVTCDNKGNVKGIKDTNPVTITAKTSSGLEATCEVVVPKEGKIRTILTGGFGFPDLFEKNIFESSNPSIISVENDKLVPKNYGECVVTGHLKEHPEILSFRYKCYVLENIGERTINVETGTQYEMNVGDTLDLNAELTSTKIDDDDMVSAIVLDWKSSDNKVVSVKGNNRSAKLTAKGEGKCTIEITDGMGANTILNVTVSNKVIPATKVAFDSDIMNLEFLHDQKLHLNVTPSNANEKITFTSSDSSYVTVSDDGTLTAEVMGGVSTITAKTESGKEASIKVVVPIVKGYTWTPGNTIKMESLFEDDIFESDNNAIVSVEDGNLVLKKEGKAEIKAHMKGNPNIITARYVINVSAPTKIEEILFESRILNINFLHEKYLKKQIKPENGQEKITFTSSNPEYVTVSNNGTVKGVQIGGVAEIKASTSSGIFDTCIVVSPYSGGVKMAIGGTHKLSCINEDDVWESDNEKVATVKDGVVTAKGVGRCIVTAHLKDYPDILTSDYVINVVEDLGSMHIDVITGEDYKMKVGDKITIKAEIVSTVEDNDESELTMEWKSSNTSIAQVKGNNRKATVTAVKPGKCDIVVSTQGMEETIKIEVVKSEPVDNETTEEPVVTTPVTTSNSNEKKTTTKEADKPKDFVDVKKDDWFKQSVDFVTSHELMNGVAKDEFDPSSQMTRGMLVTVLYRFEKSEVKEQVTFDDVNQDEYYAFPIAWAVKNNIVYGVGDNKFAPNAPITREQLIVILYRYANFAKKNIKIDSQSDITSYEDYTEISDYSVDAFKWGYSKKIIQGRTQTLLKPQGTATRAEVATMIMRYVEQ